jgi:hypothetical protein
LEDHRNLARCHPVALTVRGSDYGHAVWVATYRHHVARIESVVLVERKYKTTAS